MTPEGVGRRHGVHHGPLTMSSRICSPSCASKGVEGYPSILGLSESPRATLMYMRHRSVKHGRAGMNDPDPGPA